MGHDEDGVYSNSSCLLVALSHSTELFTHPCLIHFSCCRVVLDFLVLGDSLFCVGMYNAIDKFLHIRVVVVCEASWACCDELVRRSHGVVVSVVDVFRH